MIDVMFNLVLFFLASTTFLRMEKEIDLELPHAQSGHAEQDAPEEIVINVLKDGRITVAGATLEGEDLLKRLHQAAARNPKTPVTIRGDRLVQHERIVHVLDACGRAGLAQLSVGTLEGE
jgi:biopolymer transport protein ExbD